MHQYKQVSSDSFPPSMALTWTCTRLVSRLSAPRSQFDNFSEAKISRQNSNTLLLRMDTFSKVSFHPFSTGRFLGHL
ncbi:hypothetical protein CcCBS67573_g10436 [Chytriomyces confervae]|uniref:Uncharacterized protein n=1 Tax=Chytriomyces confervae TaxID=246404 RepID=A0A507CXP7_9FUNG|nr:hypothetical protein CcCBS67573_g10436 [Chytriomyces confervae]